MYEYPVLHYKTIYVFTEYKKVTLDKKWRKRETK